MSNRQWVRKETNHPYKCDRRLSKISSWPFWIRSSIPSSLAAESSSRLFLFPEQNKNLKLNKWRQNCIYLTFSPFKASCILARISFARWLHLPELAELDNWFAHQSLDGKIKPEGRFFTSFTRWHLMPVPQPQASTKPISAVQAGITVNKIERADRRRARGWASRLHGLPKLRLGSKNVKILNYVFVIRHETGYF